MTRVEDDEEILILLDFASTGWFRILCLTSSDLLEPDGVSAQTVIRLGKLILQFPVSILEQVILHPRLCGMKSHIK